MDGSFFSQQMPHCLATLLVYMALTCTKVLQNTTQCRIHITGCRNIVNRVYVVFLPAAIEFVNDKTCCRITCSRHRNLQNIRIRTLQIFCYDFFA